MFLLAVLCDLLGKRQMYPDNPSVVGIASQYRMTFAMFLALGSAV